MEIKSVEILGVRKYSLGDKIGDDTIGWIEIDDKNNILFLNRKLIPDNSKSRYVITLGYYNDKELLQIRNCTNYIVVEEDEELLLEQKLLVLEKE
jgi:hypothetical protein